MATTSRGLRNNNPLNIRHNADKFQGEVVPSSDKSFKQFKSASWGYRAAFVTLATYLDRGKKTIEKIITTWAPPSENNTAGYIEKVERWSGLKRDKPLTADSGEDYVKIVIAMSKVENGVDAVPTDVRAGFDLQTRLKTHLY
ncbi:hypothetical protein FACS189451_12180 [Bacteroidia bacterium]|nr:hypothetical protein FACS189451_12180 [Bacteroidia bacterium]